MKITHILECAGGVERYLELLAPRLKKEEFEQTMISSQSVNLDKLKESGPKGDCPWQADAAA